MIDFPISSRDLAITVAVTAALSLACLAGLPEWLGAHPWWAAKSGIIGSMIGALAFLVLRLLRQSSRVTLWLGLVGLIASVASAVIGKRIFVASMAENVLAGRLWFLGWFAVLACLDILAIAVVRRVLGR